MLRFRRYWKFARRAEAVSGLGALDRVGADFVRELVDDFPDAGSQVVDGLEQLFAEGGWSILKGYGCDDIAVHLYFALSAHRSQDLEPSNWCGLLHRAELVHVPVDGDDREGTARPCRRVDRVD